MEPLWMPKGSVRSLLALGALATTVGLMVSGQEVPREWWPLLATVLTYYFAKRDDTTGSDIGGGS